LALELRPLARRLDCVDVSEIGAAKAEFSGLYENVWELDFDDSAAIKPRGGYNVVYVGVAGIYRDLGDVLQKARLLLSDRDSMVVLDYELADNTSLDKGQSSAFQKWNWKHRWNGKKGWEEVKIVGGKSDGKKALLAVSPA
jgi:hypothetical protein